MREYSKPVIIESNEMFEGVYALDSGVEPQVNGWVEWSNHNSGSHSDLSVYVKVAPGFQGNYIKATVTFVGRGVIEHIGGSGGPAQMSWSGNTVTFVRQEHFNPGEQFQFNFNNVTFSETGDDHDTSVHKGSYYETGTHIGDAGADFVINVEAW